jgi:hypothetical protein
MALLCLAVALPAGNAVAQQKQHVSYKSPAENAKYTQQTVIDAGDVTGHQVRIFETHRSFPNNAPVINGLKVTEQWSRGMTDFIDNNGTVTSYSVYVLENGDKFFTRTTAVSQSIESGKRTTKGVGYITGGTGKLAGIQGILRSSGSAEAGVTEQQTDIEYSIAK